jgi:ankyrin repeat protein
MLTFFLADQFGNTPLLEAVKQGHERVAALLYAKGAKLSLKNAGSHLCTAVAKGDSDFIRRSLACGADPNCMDYDHRTPLHIAAAEGLYLIAKMLVDAGASVFATDRYTSKFVLMLIVPKQLRTRSMTLSTTTLCVQMGHDSARRSAQVRRPDAAGSAGAGAGR